MPLSIFIEDVVKWIWRVSWFAQNLVCHLTETPDVDSLVVWLTILNLRRKFAWTYELDLLNDTLILFDQRNREVKIIKSIEFPTIGAFLVSHFD